MFEHFFQLYGYCLCVFEVLFCKQNSCHIFHSGILRLREPFYYDGTSPNCQQMPYDIYHTYNFSLPGALLLHVLRFYQGNLLMGIDNFRVRIDLWCKLLHKKARDNSFSNSWSIRWINWNQKPKLKIKNHNIFCCCKWKINNFFIHFE